MGNPSSTLTAVHQGLSKNLTAQDTHISTTSTNHSRTLSSHGNLLSLQSQFTIQEYKKNLFLTLSKLILKLDIALSWNNKIYNLSFSKVKRNKTGSWQFYHYLFMAKIYTQVHFPPFPPSSFIWINCLKFWM